MMANLGEFVGKVFIQLPGIACNFREVETKNAMSPQVSMECSL